MSECLWVGLHGWYGVREPTQHRPCEVIGTVFPCVVLLEAELAPWDGLGPSREGLIVEGAIRLGPIEVLVGQGFSAVLPVVCHPHAWLIVSFCPDDNP